MRYIFSGRIFALILLITFGAQTASAQNVTFELSTEDGSPAGNNFKWLLFGPSGITDLLSAGASFETTLDTGAYDLVLLRIDDNVVTEAEFTVQKGSQTVALTVPNSQPAGDIKPLVTIELVSLPRFERDATHYQWTLSQNDAVFFNKDEPLPSLTLPIASLDTTVIVTRFPDEAQVSFQFRPKNDPRQTFQFSWREHAVATPPVNQTDGTKQAANQIDLSAQLTGDLITVTIDFNDGTPTEGDSLWLGDGRPGALAMAFVQAGQTQVTLPLPSSVPADGLTVTYRQAQSLTALAQSPIN